MIDPSTPLEQLEPPAVVVVEAEPVGCPVTTNGGHLPCRLVAGHPGLHQLADGTVFTP